MGRRKWLWAAALVAGALLAPASARAAPATNVTVSEAGGRLTVNWELALNSLSSGVELAHTSKTAVNGSFSDPGKVTGTVDESETTYTSPPLANGTWYVHVGSYDPTGDCPINPKTGDIKCKQEWSTAAVVTIGLVSGAGGDAATGFTNLLAAARQRAAKLRIKATMGESGTITAAGKLSVRGPSGAYRLGPVSAKAAAGKVVTLRLKLSKKALAAVKKALARHRKVRAKLTITARDVAGNTKTEKRIIRLTA